RPCRPSHEGICELLIADSGLRSMARIDCCVIVQLEQAAPDRMDESVEVPSWKLCPSDCLVEESVTCQDVSVAGQADAAVRMAWSVGNRDRLISAVQAVTVFELASDHGRRWT